jgi:hypothetical protein
METFRYITDPGHGWVEVPFSLIKKLGIAEKVSTYSYVCGTYVYLEEDCDAAVFVDAYKQEFGHEPTMAWEYEEHTRIRKYAHYIPKGVFS